jgi:hypothetical protein
MEEDGIYEMKLHDVVTSDSGEFSILRVAGGWIYTAPTGAVFVPFHNEFMTPGAYLPDNELPY